ncbi:MAG TPA: hypothetical protein VKS81_00590, partial [Bacteroidota bacterium]|nr:hypothetical protein [Bacteroidota bacterium]
WYFNPSISGTISLESYFINGYYTVWWLLCALSAIALFVSRSSDERRFGPRQQFGSLLIFSAIYVQILHVFGAPDMPWYIFTFFYSSELLVFFLIFHFWEHKKNLISISLCIVAFAASSLACYNFIDTRLVQRFQASGKIEFSRLGNNDRRERIGLWLNKNFQDISSKKILLYEAGKVPYYSGAKCYDLLGLVTKESFQNLRNGDMLQTLLDIKPDLVVGDKNPEYYPMSFLKSPYFGNHYRMIFEIDGYCVWSRI